MYANVTWHTLKQITITSWIPTTIKLKPERKKQFKHGTCQRAMQEKLRICMEWFYNKGIFLNSKLIIRKAQLQELHIICETKKTMSAWNWSAVDVTLVVFGCLCQRFSGCNAKIIVLFGKYFKTKTTFRILMTVSKIGARDLQAKVWDNFPSMAIDCGSVQECTRK